MQGSKRNEPLYGTAIIKRRRRSAYCWPERARRQPFTRRHELSMQPCGRPRFLAATSSALYSLTSPLPALGVHSRRPSNHGLSSGRRHITSSPQLSPGATLKASAPEEQTCRRPHHATAEIERLGTGIGRVRIGSFRDVTAQSHNDAADDEASLLRRYNQPI